MFFSEPLPEELVVCLTAERYIGIETGDAVYVGPVTAHDRENNTVTLDTYAVLDGDDYTVLGESQTFQYTDTSLFTGREIGDVADAETLENIVHLLSHDPIDTEALSDALRVACEAYVASQLGDNVTVDTLENRLDGVMTRKDITQEIQTLFDQGMLKAAWREEDDEPQRCLEIAGEAEDFVERVYQATI